MKRSRHFLDTHTLMTVAAAAAAAVWGCGPSLPPVDPSVSIVGPAPTDPCEISSDSIRRLTRREFTAWARRLPYDSQDRSLGWAHGFDPDADVRVFRARGMDRVTRAQLADGCVIARVSSRRADRRLGLGIGWTYIWADSASPFVVSTVPEDPSVAPVGHNLAIASTQPDPVSVQSPRHICSGCGRDWCVYPTDTLRAEPVLFEPEIGLRDVLGQGITLATAGPP